MSLTEKNREIRKILKENFPETKFSVTKRNCSTSNISWINGPTNNNVETVISSKYYYVHTERTITEEVNNIVKNYIKSKYASIDDIEIERLTRDTLKETSINEDFSVQVLIDADEKKRIQHEKDVAEYTKKQLEEKKKYERKEKRKQIAKDRFVAPVVIDLDHEDFIVTKKFARLNKNCTLKEYEYEVKNNRYDINDCVVKRIVRFNDWYSWTYFVNNLMDEYNFCTDNGGSCLLKTDPRYEELENADISIFNSDENLEYYRNNCYTEVIQVTYKNKKIYVDPQGYSYARYVGI